MTDLDTEKIEQDVDDKIMMLEQNEVMDLRSRVWVARQIGNPDSSYWTDVTDK